MAQFPGRLAAYRQSPFQALLTCLLALIPIILVPRAATCREGNHSTWTAIPFVPRSGHSLTLDPSRHRLIMFGGTHEVPLEDLWQYRLDAQVGWEPLTTIGAAPAARYLHSAVYDPRRDRLLVLGGICSGCPTTETWELALGSEPARWTLIQTQGEQPRLGAGHSATLDPLGDRVILIGGESTETQLMELQLSGAPTYTPLMASGSTPPGRSGHGSVYDPLRHRLLLYGGFTTDSCRSLVDILDLTTTPPAWSVLSVQGTVPPPRAYATLAYDSNRDQALLYAGLSCTDGILRSDAWLLSLGTTPNWVHLATDESGPAARWCYGAVLDPSTDQMCVVGGNVLGFNLSDTWHLSLSTLHWNQAEPSPRRSHSIVYDDKHRRAIVFGGTTINGLSNDIWALDIDNHQWSEIVVQGQRPAPKSRHLAILDQVRQRMIVFGGSAAGIAGVWSLSLTEPYRWDSLTSSGDVPINNNRWHAAEYHQQEDCIYMVGGGPTPGALPAAYRLIVGEAEVAWMRLELETWGPREWATGVGSLDELRRRMVLYGCSTGACDVWTLELTTPPRWERAIVDGEAPPPMSSAVAAGDDNSGRLFVVGGSNWEPRLPVLQCVDGVNDTPTYRWEYVEIAGTGFYARNVSAVTFNERGELIVCGGSVPGALVNDYWMYRSKPVPTRVRAITWTSSQCRDGRRVHEWGVFDEAIRTVRVMRRSQGEEWRCMGEASVGRGGVIAFVDAEAGTGDECYYVDGGGVRSDVRCYDGVCGDMSVTTITRENGHMVVEFAVGVSGSQMIEAFDVAGRRVGREVIAAVAGNRCRVRLSSAGVSAAGVYYVVITFKDERKVSRAVLLE